MLDIGMVRGILCYLKFFCVELKIVVFFSLETWTLKKKKKLVPNID